MSNPLVAGPIDTATPFSGAGILDSGTQLAEAIESGDWVMGGLAAFSTAADTVATVSDPLGSLIGAGLGWLMDHMEPLKGWMNDLTGDAGEVAGFAQTWSNMEAQLDGAAQELERVVGDLDELAGQAIDAYRRFQADSAEHIRAAGRWAGAMATGLEVASTIVQVVHDLVRDVLSQLIGSAISWAAEAVFTLGLATPWIIEQVATRVASLAAKVGSKVTAVLQSCKSLMKLLDELKVLFRNAGDLFDKVLKGGSKGPTGASDRVARSLDNPLTAAQRDQIIALEKGLRPDPSTYLPPEYIRQHLGQFDDGATRFMTQSNLEKYGIGQRDGTGFVLPKSQIDDLIRTTGGDPRAMEDALGLPEGFFDNGVVRVDIDSPRDHGLRMPSGNEAGANDEWIPGGKLPTGFSEAVIDAGKLDADSFDVSRMDR